ncbi:MAG: hypothetical protein RMK18_11715 [Armatimonadota bacterium]|nr:hypothetical protein [Armatimonadota bacterium]MDW8026513.1 hypothetical protein [Armatimonadota bacterium]
MILLTTVVHNGRYCKRVVSSGLTDAMFGGGQIADVTKADECT